MKNKTTFLIHNVLIVFTIFSSSCANISSPTGGPKDVTSPKLLSSIPKQGKTNYKDKTIQLTFNEEINPQFDVSNLIITPLNDNPIKYKIKKNKLTLNFEKNLDSNTTYTINFRETIKDLTEGNVAPNLILAFSTGKYIDSNTIEGTIINIQNNLPKSDILIGLYQASDTFQAKKTKPYYFTKTDKKGYYKLENIKSDNYDLIAFDDKNKNLLFNDEENLAYTKTLNFDTANILKINLKLSKFYSALPSVKSLKKSEDKIEITLNDGIKKFNYYSDIKEEVYPTLSENGNTITLYKTFSSTDSISSTIELIDSVGNTSENKIKYLFEKEKNQTITPIQLSFDPKDNLLRPYLAEISIMSNKPITEIDTTKLLIQADTNLLEIKSNQLEKIDWNKILIKKENKAQDSLFLIIKSNAFNSYDTTISDQKIKFKIKKEENYSLLEFKIITNQKNYIIQLLDKNYSIVESKMNINKGLFTYIKPGTYYIRAIIDENHNGYWDAGNLLKNEQPEDIIFYPNPIELRANWEIRDLIFEF